MWQTGPEPHVVRPDPRLFVYSHVHSSRYFHHEVTFTSGFMFRSDQATSAGVIAQSCRANRPRKHPFILLTQPEERYFFCRCAPSKSGRYCGAIAADRIGLNRHVSDQKRHQKLKMLGTASGTVFTRYVCSCWPIDLKELTVFCGEG